MGSTYINIHHMYLRQIGNHSQSHSKVKFLLLFGFSAAQMVVIVSLRFHYSPSRREMRRTGRRSGVHFIMFLQSQGERGEPKLNLLTRMAFSLTSTNVAFQKSKGTRFLRQMLQALEKAGPAKQK